MQRRGLCKFLAMTRLRRPCRRFHKRQSTANGCGANILFEGATYVFNQHESFRKATGRGRLVLMTARPSPCESLYAKMLRWYSGLTVRCCCAVKRFTFTARLLELAGDRIIGGLGQTPGFLELGVCLVFPSHGLIKPCQAPMDVHIARV